MIFLLAGHFWVFIITNFNLQGYIVQQTTGNCKEKNNVQLHHLIALRGNRKQVQVQITSSAHRAWFYFIDTGGIRLCKAQV
jgi:hypothetical protein